MGKFFFIFYLHNEWNNFCNLSQYPVIPCNAVIAGKYAEFCRVQSWVAPMGPIWGGSFRLCKCLWCAKKRSQSHTTSMSICKTSAKKRKPIAGGLVGGVRGVGNFYAAGVGANLTQESARAPDRGVHFQLQLPASAKLLNEIFALKFCQVSCAPMRASWLRSASKVCGLPQTHGSTHTHLHTCIHKERERDGESRPHNAVLSRSLVTDSKRQANSIKTTNAS